MNWVNSTKENWCYYKWWVAFFQFTVRLVFNILQVTAYVLWKGNVGNVIRKGISFIWQNSTSIYKRSWKEFLICRKQKYLPNAKSRAEIIKQCSEEQPIQRIPCFVFDKLLGEQSFQFNFWGRIVSKLWQRTLFIQHF